MTPVTYNLQKSIGRRGMTLIELMVVVVILALLLTILLPSMLSMQKIGRSASTRASIATLTAACDMYRNDFQAYPDSTPASGLQGRHRLMYFLTGKTLADPDSRGWRLGAKRGVLYGAERFGVTAVPFMTESGQLTFADAFGQPIYYYAYRGGNFVEGDNSGGPSPIGPYATDANGKPVTGMMLISKGYNNQWDAKSAGKSDDVTNFWR